MDPSVLQKIINAVEQAMQPGMAGLRGFLIGFTSLLVFLEALRVYGAVLDDGLKYKHVVGFLMRTFILLAVYWNWPAMFNALIEDFVGAGLRFGGNHLTVQQFMDPGLLMRRGLQTGLVLKDVANANAGLLGAAVNAAYFLPFLVCWVLYLGAYAWMACGVFLTQVELYIILPVSLFVLAFAFWRPTANMATGVLSYMLNVCLIFFLKAIMASLIFLVAPLLAPAITTKTAFDVAIEQAFMMVVFAIVLAVLFTKVTTIVSRHLSGMPSLTAGGFVQTVAGLVGMVAGGAGLLAPRGGAWTFPRPAPKPPQLSFPWGGSGGSVPAARVPSRPPPMPAGQAVQQMLRSGAQYLGHDNSQGGLNVHL